jgi:crossover junction endodeoxyribonuclease RusA
MEIECQEFKGAFDKEDRISLEVYAHPPDRRRRDIDNILKCLCDGLQHAGVYEDDCQIDEIHISRAKSLGGTVIVDMWVIS